jgi:hypothetical protein
MVAHMKYLLLLAVTVSLINISGCANPKVALNVEKRYCFVVETADNRLSSYYRRILPIKEKDVLLFPVITRGIVKGKKVDFGLGSPVLYKQGEDVNRIHFEGIDRWPRKWYMVWARGYYMRGIPRNFLYFDVIDGKKCLLLELTPLKPVTDQKAMEEAMIRELKKGKIQVDKRDEGLDIADVTDYSQLIKATELKSWIKDAGGFRDGMVLWAQPGVNVDILLTENDFKLIDAYLHNGQ